MGFGILDDRYESPMYELHVRHTLTSYTKI
jgi:hypothetical protein